MSKSNQNRRKSLGIERIQEFLREVGADGARRKKLLENPLRFLRQEGVSLLPDTKVQVHENTRDIFHFVFPPDPNEWLDDETLTSVAGGKGEEGYSWGGCASRPPDYQG